MLAHDLRRIVGNRVTCRTEHPLGVVLVTHAIAVHSVGDIRRYLMAAKLSNTSESEVGGATAAAASDYPSVNVINLILKMDVMVATPITVDMCPMRCTASIAQNADIGEQDGAATDCTEMGAVPKLLTEPGFKLTGIEVGMIKAGKQKDIVRS